ncbi:MAG: type II toxin-antitoxin system RelE/ParE family toxin [Alphaproteobacteria bacterium]|nr:type II toxin-antitoxin system RelE/ParE family toxin [Alphaproteobacteria bacterium]
MASLPALRLRVTRRAREQLHAIDDYIRARNTRVATEVGDRLEAEFDLLRHRPFMGRRGHSPGTREKSVVRYPYDRLRGLG